MKLHILKNKREVADKLKAEIQSAEAEMKGAKGSEKHARVVSRLVEAVDIPIVPKAVERLLWGVLIELGLELLKAAGELVIDSISKKSTKKGA